MSVTFLKKPYVDVRLEGIGKQLALIPGLEKALLGLVGKVIEDLMVLPKKIQIQTVPGDHEELIPQPRGVLRIKVINALNLPMVRKRRILNGKPQTSVMKL